MMISNSLAPAAKLRYDINAKDTVQTVWTEFSELKLLVGGVYRGNRKYQPDLEKDELDQLATQVLRATSTGLNVLLIGDTNLDHINDKHHKAAEASEFMQYIEAANMRHLVTGPTWISHGLFKICNCSDH